MNVTQYQFNNKEILTALLREAGITEGHWELGVLFGSGIIPAQSPNHLLAHRLEIVGLQITRVFAATEWSVDASTLAPDWEKELTKIQG